MRPAERIRPRRTHHARNALTALTGALERVVLKPDTSGRVVDYGCGGQPYRHLFTAPGCEYIGADLPSNPQAEMHLGPNGQLPAEDGWADTILSTQVLEHVPDPARYLAEARRVLRPGGALLLSTHGVWTYHPHPGDYGIRAAAQFLTERQLSYTIVGDGPDCPRLQSLIENLGVSEHVRIAGWSDHRSIRDFLYNAEIVVLPSVTFAAGDMEGIPVSLIEAMATGLPALSTTHSGIPELVTDGVEGFLVPERDSALLAGRPGLLLDSPQLRPEMGARARSRVETHNTIRVQNDRLIESYRTLINAESVRC